MEVRDKRAVKNLPIVMDMNVTDFKVLYFMLKKTLRLMNPGLDVMPNFIEAEVELAERFVKKFKRLV